jgi:hypothetical protein
MAANNKLPYTAMKIVPYHLLQCSVIGFLNFASDKRDTDLIMVLTEI